MVSTTDPAISVSTVAPGERRSAGPSARTCYLFPAPRTCEAHPGRLPPVRHAPQRHFCLLTRRNLMYLRRNRSKSTSAPGTSECDVKRAVQFTAPQQVDVTEHSGASPRRALGRSERRRLRREARRVLSGNWTGSSRCPPALSIRTSGAGTRRSSRSACATVRVACATGAGDPVAAQWGDGRIPHIVYNPAVPPGAYFPGPDFWRSSTAARGRSTAHGRDLRDRAAARARARRLAGPPGGPRLLPAARLPHPGPYPRLAAWHGYLADHRDLGGGGLSAVVHPWESGMDNSPCWDGPLARVDPPRPAPSGAPTSPRRRRRAPHRPGLRAVRAPRRRLPRPRLPGATTATNLFAVEDPAFNALFAASEHALAASPASRRRPGSPPGAGAAP